MTTFTNKELTEELYKYYPKGIPYFSDRHVPSEEYGLSVPSKKLSQGIDSFFGNGMDYGMKLIELLSENGVDQELRDATNIPMGDRAFNIQYYGFFNESTLKYYPLCLVFSGILPLYHYFYVDIDIALNPKTGTLGTYTWERNNGRFENWESNPDMLNVVKKIRSVVD